MTEKYAVFIDIDGTLTSERFVIPDENIRWLKEAQKQGHKIFINTGRSWGNIPESMRQATAFFDGVVCGNGSHIIIGGEHIVRRSIPSDVVLRMIDYFISHRELWCVLEGENELFFIDDTAHTRHDMDEIERVVSSQNFASLHGDSPIEVIAGGRHLPDDFESLFPELNVFRLDRFADCVCAGCSKANGLKQVAEALGFDHMHTMAIGDSENDLPMLEAAGISVAMDNAPQSIKNIADFVTLDNESSGVAYAIKQLLFKE